MLDKCGKAKQTIKNNLSAIISNVLPQKLYATVCENMYFVHLDIYRVPGSKTSGTLVVGL
jgi:hypothetical protein